MGARLRLGRAWAGEAGAWELDQEQEEEVREKEVQSEGPAWPQGLRLRSVRGPGWLDCRRRGRGGGR